MARYYSGNIRRQFETPAGAQIRQKRLERKSTLIINLKVTATVMLLIVLAGLAG